MTDCRGLITLCQRPAATFNPFSRLPDMMSASQAGRIVESTISTENARKVEGASPASPSDKPATSWRADFLAVFLLVLAAVGLHGHGLTLGFWFDDHSHLELCQKNGFSD